MTPTETKPLMKANVEIYEVTALEWAKANPDKLTKRQRAQGMPPKIILTGRTKAAAMVAAVGYLDNPKYEVRWNGEILQP